jgi:hypothetical protein
VTADEKFFAWLDGELDVTEAAEMEARVAADPRLARLAKSIARLLGNSRTRSTRSRRRRFPKRLEQGLRKRDADVADLAMARRASAARLVRSWALASAMGGDGRDPGPRRPRRDDGPAARHLRRSRSRDRHLRLRLPRSGARFRPRQRPGPGRRADRADLPRSRRVDLPKLRRRSQASGLACREGDRWQVRGLFAAPEGQATDYRMAWGMDPNLAALIDSTMASEPFDAAQERAARDKGWR